MIVEVETKLELNLPPGFKFYPTDEELVLHYLCRKVQHKELPVPIIADIDLYKFDPWQLPEKALFGEKEWYFFTPRDRKYPNGSRPNRAAGSGYWKATGADKHIRPPSISGRHYLGIKKALVFYAGKAPRGHKTNWIMHEYRLVRSESPAAPHKEPRSLRLDDWVLCRIYNKKNSREKIVHQQLTDQEDSAVTGDEEIIMGNLGSDSKSTGCYEIVDQEQKPDFFNGLTDLAPLLRTSLISNGTGADMNEAAAVVVAADPLFGFHFQQEGQDDYHLPGVPSLSDFAKEWLSAYENQMLTF